MKLQKEFAIAFTALRRNRLRAALTALGIVVGISAVIAMMELGEGSSRAIQKTISSMGANTLLVQPGPAASGGVSYGAGSTFTLTPDDGEAVAKYVKGLRAVTNIVRARAQLIYGNKNWIPMNIYGTTPTFLQVREWSVAEGSMFSDADVRSGTPVCLVGATVATELFGGRSPVGEELRIQNAPFKVIGVLAAKGANMMGNDQDDVVIAPWTTVKSRIAGSQATTNTASTQSSESTSGSPKLYPSNGVSLYPTTAAITDSTSPSPVRFSNIDQILLGVTSPELVPSVMAQITTLLRERHRIRTGELDDFNLRDMSELTKALSSTSAMMSRLLLSVALISLVVGGIGIMNIMLVSVTERTREIGLRMAVGARQKDILRQFLTEAIVLCTFGGVVGIVIGRGASLLVRTFLNWPTVFSPTAVIASLIVSAGVGIAFGYYPAKRASKLNPIEALRYE